MTIHLKHPDPDMGWNAICLTGKGHGPRVTDEDKVTCLFCIAYITAQKLGFKIVKRKQITKNCYSLICDNVYEFILRFDSNQIELFDDEGKLVAGAIS